jgi:hypothetical protein
MLALFLVMGAIVNVAVALGAFLEDYESSPLTSRPTILGRNPDADDTDLWERHRGDGWFESPMNAFTEDGLLVTRRGCAARAGGLIEYSRTSSRKELREAFHGMGDFRVEQVESGFPARALHWECWDSDLASPAGVFTPHAGHDGVQIGTHVVPGTALWRGFAINTVFYAAVLWLLFAAPFALRKRRRIKRGLCPKCAYPVGTSEKCTECGAAVTVQPRRGDGV